MPSDPTGPFARQKSRCFNPRPAPRCRATALRALAAPLLVVSIRARHLDAERHARQFVGLHADQVSIRARHLDAERQCLRCPYIGPAKVSIRARHLDAERPVWGSLTRSTDHVSIRARHLDAERHRCTILAAAGRMVSIRARHLDAERPDSMLAETYIQGFNPRPAPRCRATAVGDWAPWHGLFQSAPGT